MVESNTNLFSRDLLFTTVFALHWEFLADFIMRLKQIPLSYHIHVNQRTLASFFLEKPFDQLVLGKHADDKLYCTTKNFTRALADKELNVVIGSCFL